ncbi:hypothetical protein AGMMS50256_30260 [Betaproteobacteria bacterium]|nr:hypothetical protein AGMMS50256_30260 [Betaproteobacteria bacterium]
MQADDCKRNSSLTAAFVFLAGLFACGMADAQSQPPQAAPQMPFLAEQMLQGQQLPQQAGQPPGRTMEQDIDETRAGIERQRWQLRENRDKTHSKVEKGWTDVIGGRK